MFWRNVVELEPAGRGRVRLWASQDDSSRPCARGAPHAGAAATGGCEPSHVWAEQHVGAFWDGRRGLCPGDTAGAAVTREKEGQSRDRWAGVPAPCDGKAGNADDEDEHSDVRVRVITRGDVWSTNHTDEVICGKTNHTAINLKLDYHIARSNSCVCSMYVVGWIGAVMEIFVWLVHARCVSCVCRCVCAGM